MLIDTQVAAACIVIITQLIYTCTHLVAVDDVVEEFSFKVIAVKVRYKICYIVHSHS